MLTVENARHHVFDFLGGFGSEGTWGFGAGGKTKNSCLGGCGAEKSKDFGLKNFPGNLPGNPSAPATDKCETK